MTVQDSPKSRNPEDSQGFPLELKLLLAVIGVGLLTVMLKVSGIL